MFTKKPERPEREMGPAGGQQSTGPSLKPSNLGTQAPTRPATGLKGADRATPSVIGEGLTLMGNAISKGEVQVDGEIQGDIQCAQLMVGESARITGGVVAEDVIVRGKVMGSIRGMRVTLQSSSHVEGDIYHHSLAIEQGAYFEGKSRRKDDPLADATLVEAQSPQTATPTAAPGNGTGVGDHGVPSAAARVKL